MFALGMDVEVEYVHRYSKGRASIWNVDQPSYMALYGCAAEEEINLIVVISEAAQIFDTPECGLSI